MQKMTYHYIIITHALISKQPFIVIVGLGWSDFNYFNYFCNCN